MKNREEHEADDPGEENQERFGNFESDQNSQCHKGDEGGRNIEDGPLAENKSGAGDGAGGRRGDAFDEGAQLRLIRVALEPRRRQNHEKIYGHEDTDGCEAGAEEAADEIADKAHRDDHRPRSNHRDRDGIQELPVIEPGVFLHDAAVEKRHDGETAAEHKRSGFGKKPENARESFVTRRRTEPRV